MIKNIIFDIGNVLIHFDWKGFLRKLNASQEDIQIVGEKAVHSPLWRTLDENKVPFNEIKQALKDAVGPQREHWIELMLDHYSGLCSTLPYTLPWLSSLKSRGYKIFVLSNVSQNGFLKAKPYFPFLKYADGYLISYEVKLMKPDKAIYLALCQKYGLDPAECVMIDDLEENVSGARQAGMKGLVFKSFKTPEKYQRELDQLLSEG